jgi:Domain of unknown function (DUF1707)
VLPPIPLPVPGLSLSDVSREQRASDADRDTAVDILCAAVGDGRLALAELDERVEAALSARTIPELAALIADLCGPAPVTSVEPVPPAQPALPLWAGRAAERWDLLQSLAARYRAF